MDETIVVKAESPGMIPVGAKLILGYDNHLEMVGTHIMDFGRDGRVAHVHPLTIGILDETRDTLTRQTGIQQWQLVSHDEGQVELRPMPDAEDYGAWVNSVKYGDTVDPNSEEYKKWVGRW